MKRTFDVAYPVGAEDQYVHKANADMSSSAHSPATIATDVDESDLPKAAKGWVAHREPTSYEMQPVPTVKAYKNSTFLNSPHARSFRFCMEYEETMQRLAANNIKATVQFFGSARALDRLQYDKKHAALTAALAMPESSEALTAAVALKKLEAMEWMIEYLEKTRELARRLTEWSMRSRLSRDAACINGVSRSKSIAELDELDDEDSSSATKSLSEEKRASSFTYLPHATDSRSNADSDLRGGLFVCTGGAGGFMEAANRGAADVPGGRSIGMGISLPFETGLNPFVSPELAFEYHYFFTRKLCMAFHMQALVVAPGGFGTCDEMFEMMTLKQTGKMQAAMPIVLLGKDYWKRVINWEAFDEAGVINARDVDELLFTDSVDEAFDHIIKAIGSHAPLSPSS